VMLSAQESLHLFVWRFLCPARVLTHMRTHACKLQVLALGGNRLHFDARAAAAGAADGEAICKLVSALSTHCHALRYLDFAATAPVACPKGTASAALSHRVPTHPRADAHPSGANLGGRGERRWWDFGCGTKGSSGRGNGSHDGPLTLGACLWATEVLEQWRCLFQAAASGSAEELREWREEALRVLQRLLATRSVTRAELEGVVTESKLGKALSRTAALGDRNSQPEGAAMVSVVPVLAAVLKGKWKALLEGSRPGERTP